MCIFLVFVWEIEIMNVHLVKNKKWYVSKTSTALLYRHDKTNFSSYFFFLLYVHFCLKTINN